MHEVLVNRLGGLSLPRKSVVRLTDRPDMTLDVYRGRKTTIQQYNNNYHVLFGGRVFNSKNMFSVVRAVSLPVPSTVSMQSRPSTEPVDNSIAVLTAIKCHLRLLP